MTGPVSSGIAVNPIPVVRNNLPEYRQALVRERAKIVARLNKIDDEMALLERLAKVLDIPEQAVVADPEDEVAT